MTNSATSGHQPAPLNATFGGAEPGVAARARRAAIRRRIRLARQRPILARPRRVHRMWDMALPIMIAAAMTSGTTDRPASATTQAAIRKPRDPVRLNAEHDAQQERADWSGGGHHEEHDKRSRAVSLVVHERDVEGDRERGDQHRREDAPRPPGSASRPCDTGRCSHRGPSSTDHARAWSLSAGRCPRTVQWSADGPVRSASGRVGLLLGQSLVRSATLRVAWHRLHAGRPFPVASVPPSAIATTWCAGTGAPAASRRSTSSTDRTPSVRGDGTRPQMRVFRVVDFATLGWSRDACACRRRCSGVKRVWQAGQWANAAEPRVGTLPKVDSGHGVPEQTPESTSASFRGLAGSAGVGVPRMSIGVVPCIPSDGFAAIGPVRHSRCPSRRSDGAGGDRAPVRPRRVACRVRRHRAP